MPSIGAFGTRAAPRDEPDTFLWFDAEIRVSEEFGELVWIDWVEEFGYLDEDNPAAIAAGKELMRRMLHAEDFERFWSLALHHRQSSRDLVDLTRAVLEASTGRPTVRSGESSPGPEQSADESTVVFLQRVSAGRPDIEAGLVETAIAKGLTG